MKRILIILVWMLGLLLVCAFAVVSPGLAHGPAGGMVGILIGCACLYFTSVIGDRS